MPDNNEHEHIWSCVEARGNYEVLECYCGKRVTVYDE